MAPRMDLFEDVLQRIVKEINSKGTPAEICAANKLSVDIMGYLQRRKNSFSGEIDASFLQSVFQLLRVTFHTEQEKLQQSGIAFMQRLLEDERFVPKNMTGEGRQLFPEMFVNSLAELCLEGSDDTVLEILKVSLQLACQPLWMQDPYALMKIIMFCMQVCGLRRSLNIKTAACATNVQAVTSFCKATMTVNASTDAVLPRDIQTVLLFFGDNLENLQNFCDDLKGMEVLRTTLLSLYTILRHTSRSVQAHPQFQEYVWRKITPALCHWLGKPAEMYMQSISRQVQAAAGLATGGDMEMIEIKLITQIFVHLAKMYSRTDSMRCVIGSLLQRMASVASVRQRLYTLGNLVEILSSPHFLAELEGPNDSGAMPDTCLVAIIAETMANLAKIKHHEVEKICTKLALALLTSLEHVAEGNDLEQDQIAAIQAAFPSLGDTSPVTMNDLEEQMEMLGRKPPKDLSTTTEEPIGAGDAGDLSAEETPNVVDNETSRSMEFGSRIEMETSEDSLERKVTLDFKPITEPLCSQRTEKDEVESAQRFMTVLIQRIPVMLGKISTIEADAAMQQFASDYCEDEKTLFNDVPYLNADAVYVAAYQVLRFTLKARDTRFYTRRSTKNRAAPMYEKEFVGGVLGCGLLVYMSLSWIRKVYNTILDEDLLVNAGYVCTGNEPPLLQTVRDIEGSGRDHPYLHDCMRLDAMSRGSIKPEKEAGAKLARYLLGRCWKGLELSLQCVFLDMFSRTKLLSLRKELTEEVLQLMCSALGGLQRYADLCARLHLFDLCSSAYALLARVCCSSLYPQPSLNNSANHTSLLRLHPWNVLSIDVVLRRSLEMGSHNPDCWKAFFTLILQHCDDFTRSIFHLNYQVISTQGILRVPPGSGRSHFLHLLTESSSHFHGNKICWENGINAKLATSKSGFMICTGGTKVLFVPAPFGDKISCEREIVEFNKTGAAGLQTSLYCSSTVTDITTKFMGISQTKPSEALDADHSYMALGALLNSLDQCFLDATRKLNLTNLCNFVRTLGDVLLRVGSEQLMLMERLANIVILASKCGRPLLHVMIVWASAIPYLYQAGASRIPVISEKACSYIHSMISALTASVPENPHFHFNELQLKPFESLICTQVCCLELQELIVYSLCNLVETSKSDIRSGWRSLFCTLRGIQIDSSSGNLLQAMGDVYEAYLNSDSIRIFSASIWECVQSLLKLYRTALDGSTSGVLPPLGSHALKYIKHSMRLLFSLHLMADFTGLAEASRLRVMCAPFHEVDLVLANAPTLEALEEHLLEKIYGWIPGEETRSEFRTRFFSQGLPVTSNESTNAKLLEWDNGKGVLMSVHNALDSLITGLNTSWSALNNECVTTIIEILRNGAEKGSAEFTLCVVSSTLIPTIQQILRRKNVSHGGAFQQLIGLTTELVADVYYCNYQRLSEDPSNEKHLQYIYHILAECLSCGFEAIVKLATSCVRHLVSKICSIPSPSFRTVTARNLMRMLHVTFAPLRELMACYNYHSKSIYGDSGHVKIAITNDSSLIEMQRMRQSAYQILLTDMQRKDQTYTLFDPDSASLGKSFTFLIYPSELDYHVSSNLFLKRVRLECLVQGLGAHLQMQHLAQHILRVHLDPCFSGYLGSYERLLLLCGVRQTYTLASDFNHLSGLKFLIKRVLSCPHGINLYHLVETSGTIHSAELVELCAIQLALRLEGIYAMYHEKQVVKLECNINSEESLRFFVQYLARWTEDLAEDYFSCVYTDEKLTKREITVAVAPIKADDADECPALSDNLVDVHLSQIVLPLDPPVPRWKSSLRRLFGPEMLSQLLGYLKDADQLRESTNKNDGLLPDAGRKNPFRECVVPSSELPSDVAVELQAAIEEDVLVSKWTHIQPLIVALNPPGFTLEQKVSLAPSTIHLCRSLLQYPCPLDKELADNLRQYLTWLQQTLTD